MYVTASGNNSIDALAETSWATAPGTAISLTYSFLSAAARSSDASGFAPMSAAQQAAARSAMALWSSVANISFTEVASGGDIQLGTNDQGSASGGYAYLPTGYGSTYVYLNNKGAYNSVYTPGSYGPAVILHELGHALGLKHPGNYNSTGSGSEVGPYLPATTDDTDHTIMSYNDGFAKSVFGYDTTPMMYDILAMQYLYGANMAYHAGNDVYSYNDKSAPQCIWDAGGSDTLDFSACTQQATINLNAGSFSSTKAGVNNVSIAYGVTMERAVTGSGGATVFANNAGNTIDGGSGADLVYLGAGNDTVNGGGGNDTVVFARGFADYSISSENGVLVVRGDGTDTLTGVEVLQFSDAYVSVASLGRAVAGTAGNDVLAAGAGSETFSGGAGLDTVNYGGARGSYTVYRDGMYTKVTDKAGAGGVDQLVGIERIHFGDGSMVALDTGDHATAGAAYRLYQAAFNRTPDSAGLGFWIHVLDQGATLQAVAEGFMQSAEFIGAYGSNPSNTQLVTQFYNNILHRAPEAEGLAYWVGVLDQGASRAGVLADISESSENQIALLATVYNGIVYTPYF